MQSGAAFLAVSVNLRIGLLLSAFIELAFIGLCKKYFLLYESYAILFVAILAVMFVCFRMSVLILPL